MNNLFAYHKSDKRKVHLQEKGFVFLVLRHSLAMPELAAAQYGKDNIRVYKVHRDKKTGVQTVVEMTVCVLLQGEIDTSYVYKSFRIRVALTV